MIIEIRQGHNCPALYQRRILQAREPDRAVAVGWFRERVVNSWTTSADLTDCPKVYLPRLVIPEGGRRSRPGRFHDCCGNYVRDDILLWRDPWRGHSNADSARAAIRAANLDIPDANQFIRSASFWKAGVG